MITSFHKLMLTRIPICLDGLDDDTPFERWAIFDDGKAVFGVENDDGFHG